MISKTVNEEGRRILGISDGQWDSGICLVENGDILFALNEGRVSGKKLESGFPYQALRELENSFKISEIDDIVFSGYGTPPIFVRYIRGLQKLEDLIKREQIPILKQISDFLQFDLNLHRKQGTSYFTKSQRYQESLRRLLTKQLPSTLRKRVKRGKTNINFVEHHLCHAATAFFNSGFDEALVITGDGRGDGKSCCIYHGEGHKLKEKAHFSDRCSFGLLFGEITEGLGFRRHRDEGKICGLAAYGDQHQINLEFPLRYEEHLKCEYKGHPSFFRSLKKKLEDYKREDVAAWLQTNLEEEMTDLIRSQIEKSPYKKLCLAGGLFANVKLNQKIKNLEGVNEIFIAPNMSDGGLSMGAALAYYHKTVKDDLKEGRVTNKNKKGLSSIFLGPNYSRQTVRKVVRKSGLNFTREKEIEARMAALLADGKTVARYEGRLETGPRALGNRSILYRPDDLSVINWLNEKLNRTSFMPFSPSTLIEEAGKCYKNLEGAKRTAKYMNISFECTDWMKSNCPGAVHVDGTARPQLVSKKDNKSFYKTISKFYRLTGLPTVINTSFNLHGEPIVNKPSEAIRTFLKSELDYLALENFLIVGKNESNE